MSNTDDLNIYLTVSTYAIVCKFTVKPILIGTHSL